jgi:hypothetical protein
MLLVTASAQINVEISTEAIGIYESMRRTVSES